LDRERASLLARLEAQDLSEEQEQTLIDFARRVSHGLEKADANSEIRRGVIEALGVGATLACEDSRKTIRVKCILGKEYYVLSPSIRDPLALAE
jgi:hypothetical protein